MSKITGLWLFIISILPASYGQDLSLYIFSNGLQNDTTLSFQKLYFKTQVDGLDFLKSYLAEQREAGYLAVSVDSLLQNDTAIKAWIYHGHKYKWAQLSLKKIPDALLNNMGIRERAWNDQPLSPRRFAALTGKVLGYCENNGYPFASIYLDSISRHEGKGIYANLVLEPGQLTKYDTIKIEGNVPVSHQFLLTYLGIQQDDIYNESQLKLISKRLKELAFLEEAQTWSVRFTPGSSSLSIFLKERKANQLNGLIGLQPNTAETGKFMLTADVLIGLKNALGYGESLSLTYQQLQYKSPRFHADVMWPYLLGTPLGVESSFDLFKKDTTFRRTSFDIGVRYQFNAADYMKIFYQNQSNRIITPDTNYVKTNKTLPDNLDIAASGAGVEFFLERTDYKLNPRRGWTARLTASGLIRKIDKNDAITSLSDGSGYNYAALFDTVNNHKYQYRIAGTATYYLPLFKNLVLRIAYNGGYLSGSRLFMNELFQIGGFKLLRGFDEQSIYANQYHVGSLDLRFLLSRNSYFYLFNDNAYTFSRYNGKTARDYPVSLGIGITLESKTSIFNIALALGKHSGETFQFRRAKIHFGYTAYF